MDSLQHYSPRRTLTRVPLSREVPCVWWCAAAEWKQNKNELDIKIAPSPGSVPYLALAVPFPFFSFFYLSSLSILPLSYLLPLSLDIKSASPPSGSLPYLSFAMPFPISFSFSYLLFTFFFFRNASLTSFPFAIFLFLSFSDLSLTLFLVGVWGCILTHYV